MAGFNGRRVAWQLHKYLSYLVFAQVFFWVAGGVLFATLPFKAWVKGGDYIEAPAAPVIHAGQLDTALATLTGVTRVEAVASANGDLLRVESPDGVHWFDARGFAAPLADALAVEAFGQSLLKTPAQSVYVRWLADTETRLGIVDELGGQVGVWQMTVDDSYRLYFGPEGQFLKVRTDYWVWFDAFWRLHIMDYGLGEDFNNTLLRVFSWLALLFVLSGMVLSYFAARQQWRKSSPFK
ncbi:hypothetical protein [Simiduia agarivorans]|uniref:PepSY-associated TM helix family protein n=1 Tax=Simiduia agarivorans (strain DSM 21679 / JCM 13881 / BCRC 17597 / SA1) TaxID=1117647 RepID=K4L1J0_SIMAS|nr:hypothetical protein [Simiduia agarivorans]AFV00043.1 hypothetical protein M5M_14530 [Simiduia agarivorans SA1 = DSM 21679]